MDSIVSLPIRIVDWLSKQPDMNDLTFFVEFPPINKAVPLKKAIVAVGIDSIDIVDKFVENDDGVLERQEYCRLAKIKANLSVCIPFEYGGQACHDIFTRIADALTFRTNLNIAESGCTKIESDRDTDALLMTGWFLMEADFCPAVSTDENFASFLDKELLCGSHIRNEEIHVTAEDKEKWNAPFTIGFYIGSGASSRSIATEFAPSFVIVTAASQPLTAVNFTDLTVESHWGMASGSHGSQGIEIMSSGFRVFSGTVGNTSAALNKPAVIYFYAAFK